MTAMYGSLKHLFETLLRPLTCPPRVQSAAAAAAAVALFLITIISAKVSPGHATVMKAGGVMAPVIMSLKMLRIFLKEASWMDTTWSWWNVDSLPDAPLAIVGTLRT